MKKINHEKHLNPFSHEFPFKKRWMKPLLSAFFIMIFGSVVSSVTIKFLTNQYQNETEEYFHNRISSAIKLFNITFRDKLVAMDRMASRQRSDLYQEWKEDAENYYNDFQSFHSVIWIDTKFRIQWIYPEIKDNNLSERLISQKNIYEDKSLFSLKTPSSFIMGPVDLNHEDKVFLSFHPTFSGTIHTGFILAVYKSGDIFSEILDDNFYLSVRMNDQDVYIRNLDHSLNFEYHLDFYNVAFHFLAGPSYNFVQLYEEDKRSKSIHIVSLMMVLSILLSVFMMFYLSSRQHVKEMLQSLKSVKSALDETAIIGITDARGVIVDVNQKFCDISKYSRDELIGKTHSVVNSGFHDKQFWSDFWKVIASGRVWKGEIKNRDKNGGFYWVDSTITPSVDKNGRISGYTAIRIDITARKIAEEAHEAARREAEVALETRTRFLANMSHEIRTPMNGVIGLTNLLMDSVQDQKIYEKLKVIQSCGQSLLEVIDDILDFSKLEADKLEIESIPVDIREIVSHTVDLMSQRALEKGLILRSHVSPDFPELVSGDPAKLKQILVNLVGNAVKFTSKGYVSLYAESEKVTSDKGNIKVTISVKDTGCGISESGQDKLFKSFSQVDASTTRKFGGTGLGLAISKGLIEAMGGAISVDSKEGEGALFTLSFISFLTERNESEGQSDVNSSEVVMPDIRILVAEDNPVNQSVIEGYLAKIGYGADFASDGRQAVEAASGKNYDLILMDCNMPNMDGFEATRRIRALNMQESPIIIALTASAMKEDKERCIAAGMDDFISKPLRLKDLRLILDQTFRSRRKKSISDPVLYKARDDVSFKHIDLNTLRTEYEGMPDVFLKQIPKIQNDIKTLMDSMRESLDVQDARKLMLSAHQLKGSVANCYADVIVQKIFQIEVYAKENNFDLMKKIFNEIKSDFYDLNKELSVIESQKSWI